MLSRQMQGFADVLISSRANGFITFLHFGTNYGKHLFFGRRCHPANRFSLFPDFLYQRSEKD